MSELSFGLNRLLGSYLEVVMNVIVRVENCVDLEFLVEFAKVVTVKIKVTAKLT